MPWDAEGSPSGLSCKALPSSSRSLRLLPAGGSADQDLKMQVTSAGPSRAFQGLDPDTVDDMNPALYSS